MAFDSPALRYERYVRWCWSLDLDPADFKTWKLTVAKIPELNFSERAHVQPMTGAMPA